MRLGGLADPKAGRPQGAAGQGEDAALAVGPRDEGAPDRELRIAELRQQCPRPPETEPDPEPAARRECVECGLKVGGGRAGRHSRVSSSS